MIKTIMKQRGLNNTTLAKQAGVSRSTIISILSRKSKPSAYTMTAILSVFEMTLEQFYCEFSVPRELTDEEASLLENFRFFDDESKNAALTLFKNISKP